ncbi:MAG: DoxX family protein [Gemmatimonadota bacterium]
MAALRVVVAALLFIHGCSRAATGGVTGFGEFLSANHVPFGLAVAWGVTILEVVGTLVLAAGRFVRPLALYFAAELAMGIILVHAKEGWFVVGGGRNGVEYSVLLISVLVAVAWASRTPRPAA